MTVTLPSKFRALVYPGYFWNTETQHLYTAKLGVLRPMKKNSHPYTVQLWGTPIYAISHNGHRRYITERDLKSTNRYFVSKYWQPSQIEMFPEIS